MGRGKKKARGGRWVGEFIIASFIGLPAEASMEKRGAQT